MTEQKSVTLEDLVGEHILDGVDMFDERVKLSWGDEYENCEMMRFRLDGIIYLAIQDPEDGYRSSMDKIVISETPMKNTFQPQRVIGRLRTKGTYSQVDEVLELIDVHTGKTVLEIGTANTDDYYPYFVATFSPENFS